MTYNMTLQAEKYDRKTGKYDKIHSLISKYARVLQKAYIKHDCVKTQLRTDCREHPTQIISARRRIARIKSGWNLTLKKM